MPNPELTRIGDLALHVSLPIQNGMRRCLLLDDGSQFFANLYLAYFDHWIKEKKDCRYYFRYADDIVILHESKEFLHGLYREIAAYLADNLKLEVKGNWQVFPVAARGIDFVGYVFRHTHTRMRKSILYISPPAAARLSTGNKKPEKGQNRVPFRVSFVQHTDNKCLLRREGE